MIILFIILSLCLLVYFLFLRPKMFHFALNSINVVTGAVKTGKSALCVFLSIKAYRSALSAYALSCLLNRIKPRRFRKTIEKPCLYSNIPLRGVVYHPVTFDLFMRRVRPAFRSVLLFDEFSLIADANLYKNQEVSTQLLLFYKLFGHETHGGTCFISTHVLSDVHYAIKRTCGDIIYINHSTRYIPFFSVLTLRSLVTQVDDSVQVSNISQDIQDDSRLFFLPKRVFKYYDKFCYSILTDNLPVSYNPLIKSRFDSLKTKDIVTFNSQIRNYLSNTEAFYEKI